MINVLWAAAGSMLGFFVLLWIKPSVFLHLNAAWHRLWYFHCQFTMPTGFADWDLHCSCGKVWQL